MQCTFGNIDITLLSGGIYEAMITTVGGLIVGIIAMFAYIYNFIEDEGVRLIGCEAAGRGINTAETAATIATGKLGIFHGMKSYFCQDEYGQIAPVYSISAGLDYPGVGPEHAHLYDTGRAEYVPVTDDEAVDAFEYLSKVEGIIPAIESAHAVAYAKKMVPTMGKDQIVVITISGRGDSFLFYTVFPWKEERPEYPECRMMRQSLPVELLLSEQWEFRQNHPCHHAFPSELSCVLV